MITDNISLDQLVADDRFNFRSIYETEEYNDETENDSPLIDQECDYYSIEKFKQLVNKSNTTSVFHLNCRSLSAKWEAFQNLMCDINDSNCSILTWLS